MTRGTLSYLLQATAQHAIGAVIGVGIWRTFAGNPSLESQVVAAVIGASVLDAINRLDRRDHSPDDEP